MNLLKKAFFKGFNKKKSSIDQRTMRSKDFLIPTYPQNLPNYNDSKILNFTNGSSMAAHLFSCSKNIEKEFEQCINNLNDRKNTCNQIVKNSPSLFKVLKNVHK